MERHEVDIEELPEVYQTIAQICDFETAVKIAKHFSGEYVYFPTYDKIKNIVRNKQIIDDFNGYNYKYFAKKYKLTVDSIRKICKDCTEEKKTEIDENQTTFWE